MIIGGDGSIYNKNVMKKSELKQMIKEELNPTKNET